MTAASCASSQKEIGQSRTACLSRHSDLVLAISQLPKKDQLMLHLLLIENLTDAAVAYIFDIEEAAVESASVQILRRLQLI